MIDGNIRLMDVTLDELKGFLAQPNKEEDVTVSTKELAKILNCVEPRIHKYAALGMKAHRLKRDCWWKNACINWVKNDLPKVLRTK